MFENLNLKEEKFPEYEEKINFIKNTYNTMVQKSFDRVGELGKLEDFENPAIPFKKYLEDKFEELKEDRKVEKFGAYHYSIGSSPLKETVDFDTEDELIQKTLKEFADNF